MKKISFLSRFTFICNLCFLVFAIMNTFEGNRETSGGSALPTLDFFKTLIITLGLSAFIINILMCICYGVLLMLRRKAMVPKWLAILNGAFLVGQVLFYFS